MRAFVRRLRRNQSGVTALEFAIICPVMLLLIMGLAEITFQGYLQAVLTGAMQKAARDSTIEGNGTDSATSIIDSKVKAAIGNVIKTAQWDTVSRRNYTHFADIGPEYFWDTNKNGVYDAGECFVDSNGNGSWDADPGTQGQGSANAIVMYQMGFTYPRLFPIYRMLGWSGTAHLTTTTYLKNQPYKFQNTADDTKICPAK